MKAFSEQPKEALKAQLSVLSEQYAAYKAKKLSLDMSRGKPCPEQLALTLRMLDCVNEKDGYLTENGVDTRNYGLLDGIPEAKRLLAAMMGVPEDTVIVGGNSSLNMMFDYIAGAFSKGVCGGKPWLKIGRAHV